MSAVRLAIVGGGPNCTYALERLAALLPLADPVRPLVVAVFDRGGEFGSGAVHSSRQARSSYLNRVASQIAFAADESIAEPGDLLPRRSRLNFYEWMRSEAGARLALEPTDVPLRYLHGQALDAAFARYLQILEDAGVAVELVPEEVTDISRCGRSGPFLIHCGARARPAFGADHVLLVTGHGNNVEGESAPAWAGQADLPPGGDIGYVPQPYPLEARLDEEKVPPGCRVGVAGMGLTAIDIILHLTEGRGGRFIRDETGKTDRRFSYARSGTEPGLILPFGPTGLFTFCRPQNHKAVDGTGLSHSRFEHRGVFLTPEAVRRLRLARGRPGVAGGEAVRQLDFESDIFPLVVLEMAFVFFVTSNPGAAAGLHRAAAPRYREFLASGRAKPGHDPDWLIAPVLGWIRDHGNGVGRGDFIWRTIFDPVPAEPGTHGSDWQRRVAEFMRVDLDRAAEGNLANPEKAAIDGVWRDLRGILGAATDFGGLTPRSHRAFIEGRLRDYNRMSNGTGLEPMTKLLALVEAGLVNVSVGPEPRLGRAPGGRFSIEGSLIRTEREVDILIEGRAHPFDVARDRCPLYRNLLTRGIVRLWTNHGSPGDEPYCPGGIDVTRDHHPRDSNGAAEKRITILGAPVERTAFFQLSAARPHSGSQVLVHVDCWARELLSTLADQPAETAHA